MINSPVSSKVRAEGAGGDDQVPRQRFPCRPWRDHAGAGGSFLKELHSMESPCWGRSILKESQPVGGTQMKQEISMKKKEQKRRAVRG